MKKNLLHVIALSTLLFTSAVIADEVVLPVITSPSVLQEGTQRDLTAEQIAVLLPWAKDSKIFLADLLESTQGLSSADKIDRLSSGIAQAVGESAPKKSELFMRYILNRALVVNDLLAKEMGEGTVGTADTKLRALTSSIKMAIRYYDIDTKAMSGTKTIPFEDFGMDYYSFLTELNKSIFDASAQYQIQKTSLEWLQWDLYRSLNNTSYAPLIVKINNSLKMLPTKKLTDTQSISYVQQMKKVTLQLNLPVSRPGSGSVSTTSTFERTSGLSVSYYYSPKKLACYSVSSSGEPMFSSKVSDGYCASESFVYTNSKCYKVSNLGDAMLSSSVSNGYCAVENKYRYDNSKLACYTVSSDDATMYSNKVSDGYCAGQSYIYDTRKQQCFKLSTDNDVMYSSQVSDGYCAAESAYKYDTSKAACYKVSTDDTVMYSSKISDGYCASESFRYVSSTQKCYKVSTDGATMLTSPVSNGYCQ